MNREELNKELDEWLDRATSEYGRAEKRPGFETRVIAHLNSRLEKRKWHFRWIPITAAATAILLFSVYFGKRDDERRFAPGGSGELLHINQRSGGAVLQTRRDGEAVPMLQEANTMQHWARRKRSDQPSGRFLSSGLSDQERYLIAFARAASEQDISGLSGEQKFEPVQIPELDLPEFEIPEFEITSFEIEDLNTPTSGSEEKL
jgi:hypothetical protein